MLLDETGFASSQRECVVILRVRLGRGGGGGNGCGTQPPGFMCPVSSCGPEAVFHPQPEDLDLPGGPRRKKAPRECDHPEPQAQVPPCKESKKDLIT